MSVLKFRMAPMSIGAAYKEAVVIVVLLFVIMHFMLPLSEMLYKVFEYFK